MPVKNELHVIYGTDARKMVYELLEKTQIAKELNPGMHIGIKPNLVVAKKASEGATTTPAIVEGVIQYLQAKGIKKISIMEGSWVGDSTKRAFSVCGYQAISEQYGVPLHDLKEDDFVIREVDGLAIKVCKKPLEVDLLINIPVLKAHCQTLLTCALKNLKGCIPDSEKRRFHSLGLMKPIGLLGKAILPGLTIVDALAGDLTFEEGGNPVQMDRIILGKDPVLIDTYAASLLGYAPTEIEYIGIAERAGVGSANLAAAKLYEYDRELKNGHEFKPSRKAKQRSRKVIAKEACSACYGSLIHALQRLDDTGALPLLNKPVYIGQGFKGQSLDGLGIGHCTRQCTAHVPGCPPSAKAIVDFLEKTLHSR